jgi:tetratricopeptide (TPR) repeat protein
MSPVVFGTFLVNLMNRRTGQPPPAPAPTAQPGGPAAWIWAAIFALVLLAYLPALSGTFLWDDNGHVTRADLRSLAGLFRIWFEFGATQQYYPVLHSAFWFEHLVWGDSTLGYHLLNVLLHATAACLFGTLLRRLAVPGAWLAALLFALHPVCVESVAWISEQKNTLSLVLYLCAALAYLRFDGQRRPAGYALATGLFIVALLTKTVTASLPAALLVVFWWQRGRLDWRRDLLPLLPWFALGAGSGLVTAHFERVLIGAQGVDFDLSLVQRCLLAGRVFWFYLGKLAWPAELIFIYPRWTVDATQVWQWLFLFGALALLGALIWWRRARAPLATALLFGGTLFPVLGFVNVYPFVFSYVADHFQYLASLPVFALAAAGLRQLLARLPVAARYAVPGALLAVLGALTWTQCGMYRDPVMLYETTLRRNPACWMAHNNLANVLTLAGRFEEAVPHLQAAIKFNPRMAQAYSNLGDNLTRLGRSAEAIPPLEKALQLQPDYAVAHGNLGNALLNLNRLDDAMIQFQQAIRQDPGYANAECNLAIVLTHAGRTAEALPHFERSVQLDPNYADAELNWAISLVIADRFNEAMPHFERAIALQPESIDYHSTYGQALVRAGRMEAAISQFESVLRLNPNIAEAHLELAQILRRLGRLNETAAHLREVERLNPGLLRQH